jgi:hypothetical protein
MGMNMNEYAGSSFIKYEDVVNEPRRELIKEITEGDFERPVLVFESGDRLSANKTVVRVLVRAYGKNSDGMIGKEIELYAGQTEYQGEKKNSVLVKPISPTELAARLSEPDDEIPV